MAVAEEVANDAEVGFCFLGVRCAVGDLFPRPTLHQLAPTVLYFFNEKGKSPLIISFYTGPGSKLPLDAEWAGKWHL